MNGILLEQFVRESNAIENIYRDPTPQEIEELDRFMQLDVMSIDELKQFVTVYQPDAKLRNKYGMDVRVGRYIPPFGSPEIEQNLYQLLLSNLSAYELHIEYEMLHPFTDCNGRSGRALWAWKHKDLSMGFLRSFYYQALRHYPKKI